MATLKLTDHQKQNSLRRGNRRRTVIESSRCCCFRLAQAERVIVTLRILPSPAINTRGDGAWHDAEHGGEERAPPGWSQASLE
jgi:hypothetical protein